MAEQSKAPRTGEFVCVNADDAGRVLLPERGPMTFTEWNLHDEALVRLRAILKGQAPSTHVAVPRELLERTIRVLGWPTSSVELLRVDADLRALVSAPTGKE